MIARNLREYEEMAVRLGQSVFLCVCMYSCMHTCVHHLFMHESLGRSVCMSIWVNVCVHVCIHACMHVYTIRSTQEWLLTICEGTKIWQPTWDSLCLSICLSVCLCSTFILIRSGCSQSVRVRRYGTPLGTVSLSLSVYLCVYVCM